MSSRKTADRSSRDAIRHLRAVSAACCLLLTPVYSWAGDGGFPELRGPYLGQTPPETGVEVFAPGILKPATGFHSSVVFNAAGDEACWTAMSAGETYCSRLIENRWTSPEMLPFDPDFGVREPVFAFGDRCLYYLSRRPLDCDPVTRERIWFVERSPSGWSDPRVIDEVVAAHPTHWQFSFTADGNLYFTSEIAGVRGKQDIFVARWRDGSFASPESVGDGVNSGEREFCPFVSPDESYLIFARPVPEERGRSDLFISFRDTDGTWTRAVNMGDTVNSLHNEVSPVVTPDGKYLFILRVSGEINDVFWTPANIIEELRRDAFSIPVSSLKPMDDVELLAHIEEFERAIEGQPRETKQRLLREQASDFKGRTIEVSAATIASTYTRENESHVYFGYNYDPDDHLFLSEIDPPLDEYLKNHRRWVSVAKTYPSRQLSYELPVVEETFEKLENGRTMNFSCRIAALIRGKSVYCVPIDLHSGQ